jgi:hypothetical protein
MKILMEKAFITPETFSETVGILKITTQVGGFLLKGDSI